MATERDGERVAWLGPSGSGKTTLLNIVGGLDEAGRGHVIVDGENLVGVDTIADVIPALDVQYALIERLEEGIHTTKLTLVSAPAGYGKTTLLSDWFAADDRSVAWLSLDEDDNDLSFFFGSEMRFDNSLGIVAEYDMALLRLLADNGSLDVEERALREAVTREFAFAEKNWHDFEDHARAVRNERYKYIFNWGTIDELYDHDADPDETVNIAQRPAMQRTVADLKDRLFAWFDPADNPYQSDLQKQD